MHNLLPIYDVTHVTWTRIKQGLEVVLLPVGNNAIYNLIKVQIAKKRGRLDPFNDGHCAVRIKEDALEIRGLT
ncbi:MAG: hypothetical protein M0Z50_10600 [Planctomycetia bacterium]|nr:hypothetical protein [Planctomycetia bacterium]